MLLSHASCTFSHLCLECLGLNTCLQLHLAPLFQHRLSSPVRGMPVFMAKLNVSRLHRALFLKEASWIYNVSWRLTRRMCGYRLYRGEPAEPKCHTSGVIYWGGIQTVTAWEGHVTRDRRYILTPIYQRRNNNISILPCMVKKSGFLTTKSQSLRMRGLVSHCIIAFGHVHCLINWALCVCGLRTRLCSVLWVHSLHKKVIFTRKMPANLIFKPSLPRSINRGYSWLKYLQWKSHLNRANPKPTHR